MRWKVVEFNPWGLGFADEMWAMDELKLKFFYNTMIGQYYVIMAPNTYNHDCPKS